MKTQIIEAAVTESPAAPTEVVTTVNTPEAEISSPAPPPAPALPPPKEEEVPPVVMIKKGLVEPNRMLVAKRVWVFSADNVDLAITNTCDYMFASVSPEVLNVATEQTATLPNALSNDDRAALRKLADRLSQVLKAVSKAIKPTE